MCGVFFSPNISGTQVKSKKNQRKKVTPIVSILDIFLFMLFQEWQMDGCLL